MRDIGGSGGMQGDVPKIRISSNGKWRTPITCRI